MSTLTLLTLPLIGALIGYLTNYIAIRMLFRPLNPWYLLGRKLPLTPGVIPAARHKLARNIGNMVGDHLLTSRDLGRALREPDFQRNLNLLIEAQTEAIFQTKLGPLASVVPEAFRAYFKVGIKILRWRFLKQLHNHLDSEEFAQVFSQVSGKHLDELFASDLSQVLPQERRDKMLADIEKQTSIFLASPLFQQGLEDYIARKLEDYIARKLEDFLEKDGKIADLLPPSLLSALLDQVEHQGQPVLDKLAEMMAKPEAREKIITALSEGVQRFGATLGPMGAMLSGFLPPELLAEKLRAWLEEKGKDVGHWLLDEKSRQGITEALRREGEKFCQRPLKEMLSPLDHQQRDQYCRTLAISLSRIAASRESAGLLNEMLREAVESQVAQPVGGILQKILGEDGQKRTRSWTAEELLRLLRSQRVKRLLDRMLTELVEEKILSRPLGTLSDLLPREVQSGINAYLLEQTNLLLEREVPYLIEALNIRDIVTRKVDALDILRLEELLLSIMQDQFKYINLFGLIIGFFIGLINLMIIVFL